MRREHIMTVLLLLIVKISFAQKKIPACSACISGAYTTTNKIVKSLGANEWHVTITNQCSEIRLYNIRPTYPNEDVGYGGVLKIDPGKSRTYKAYKEISGYYIYDRIESCKVFSAISSKDHVHKWKFHKWF